METLVAASLLNMFFKIIDNGPGAIVPELISLSIPGSEILLAAEVLGIDLISDVRTSSALKKDQSLQRYLNLDLTNSLNSSLNSRIDDSPLNRNINRDIDTNYE